MGDSSGDTRGRPVAAGNDSTDGTLSALRERYARGDIDDEEFERRRQMLQRFRR